MIAEIGLLISAYVFVRLAELVRRHSANPTKAQGCISVAAILTCLLALLIGFDMLMRLLSGSATPTP